jgi:hypothetical protein
LAGIAFVGRSSVQCFVRHVAEATCRSPGRCPASPSRVTCAKRLCNWTEIASPLGFPKNPSAEYRSAFVQLLPAQRRVTISDSSSSGLPICVPFKRVTTRRAHRHDIPHRRTDVPRSRRPVGLCQG